MIRETDGETKNVKYYHTIINGNSVIKSTNNMESFERVCSDFPDYAYFVPEDGEWITQNEDGTHVNTPVKKGTFVLQMCSASCNGTKEVFFIDLDGLKDYYNRRMQFLEDKKNNIGDKIDLLQ